MTRQINVMARIVPKSEWEGTGLPVVATLVVLGSAIIGLLTSPETGLVSSGAVIVALAYIHFSFRRPIRIWVLLMRNARRCGRPLVWCADGNVTVLDARLFCEPIEVVRLEMSEHDGGRVKYVRCVGKNDRTAIWAGYFEPTAEEFIEDFREMQADGGGLRAVR